MSKDVVSTTNLRSDLDDELCDVCGSGEIVEGNEIVFCKGKGCDTKVHQKCYGIDTVPPGDEPWLCDRCQDGTPANLATVICCPNHNNKALKRVSNKHRAYVHINCAMWSRKVQTDGPEWTFVSDSKRKQTCYICKSNVGFCVTCSVRGKDRCNRHFHVTCAIKIGILLPATGIRTKMRRPLCQKHATKAGELDQSSARRRPRHMILKESEDEFDEDVNRVVHDEKHDGNGEVTQKEGSTEDNGAEEEEVIIEESLASGSLGQASINTKQGDDESTNNGSENPGSVEDLFNRDVADDNCCCIQPLYAPPTQEDSSEKVATDKFVSPKTMPASARKQPSTEMNLAPQKAEANTKKLSTRHKTSASPAPWSLFGASQDWDRPSKPEPEDDSLTTGSLPHHCPSVAAVDSEAPSYKKLKLNRHRRSHSGLKESPSSVIDGHHPDSVQSQDASGNTAPLQAPVVEAQPIQRHPEEANAGLGQKMDTVLAKIETLNSHIADEASIHRKILSKVEEISERTNKRGIAPESLSLFRSLNGTGQHSSSSGGAQVTSSQAPPLLASSPNVSILSRLNLSANLPQQPPAITMPSVATSHALDASGADAAETLCRLKSLATASNQSSAASDAQIGADIATSQPQTHSPLNAKLVKLFSMLDLPRRLASDLSTNPAPFKAPPLPEPSDASIEAYVDAIVAHLDHISGPGYSEF